MFKPNTIKLPPSHHHFLMGEYGWYVYHPHPYLKWLAYGIGFPTLDLLFMSTLLHCWVFTWLDCFCGKKSMMKFSSTLENCSCLPCWAEHDLMFFMESHGRDTVDGCEILHQLKSLFIPLLVGFRPSFWWVDRWFIHVYHPVYRVSNVSTIHRSWSFGCAPSLLCSTWAS